MKTTATLLGGLSRVSGTFLERGVAVEHLNVIKIFKCCQRHRTPFHSPPLY